MKGVSDNVMIERDLQNMAAKLIGGELIDL